MITITSQEAAAFAHADPIVKNFIRNYGISSSEAWACHEISRELKSLYSILSIGHPACALVITTMLAMRHGAAPGRLVHVIDNPLQRKLAAVKAENRGIPGLNILCGDIEHKATFFQAQEFGPFDVLFINGFASVPIQQRWCELLKPGGAFVVGPQIERECGDAMVQPEHLVGDVCIRRKPLA